MYVRMHSDECIRQIGWLTAGADPVQALPDTEGETEHLPTLEAISAERQKRKAVQAQLDAQAQKNNQAQTDTQSTQQSAAPANGNQGGLEGLEQEADQQGAFNPETGEINWDCPCLGGMADGPCGPEFKAAFSCFVYSSEEPKGMDCIDNFKYVHPTPTGENHCRGCG
jgi:intermembrane space import and assembly protein 40